MIGLGTFGMSGWEPPSAWLRFWRAQAMRRAQSRRGVDAELQARAVQKRARRAKRLARDFEATRAGREAARALRRSLTERW